VRIEEPIDGTTVYIYLIDCNRRRFVLTVGRARRPDAARGPEVWRLSCAMCVLRSRWWRCRPLRHQRCTIYVWQPCVAASCQKRAVLLHDHCNMAVIRVRIGHARSRHDSCCIHCRVESGHEPTPCVSAVALEVVIFTCVSNRPARSPALP